MKLRVFDICRNGTHVLGPGKRYVIWVQGCDQRCVGCITPESQSKTAGFEVDVDDLAADVIMTESIDGITISGGEPFLQPIVLNLLLNKIKTVRPCLTVIIYTGLLYENLIKIPEALELIENSDVIIDGQYIESFNDNKGIRGSNNQRVIPITNRLDNYLDTMASCVRKRDRVADKSGLVTTIGIPNKIEQKPI